MSRLRNIIVAIFSSLWLFGRSSALAISASGQAACNGAGGTCNDAGITGAFRAIATTLIVLIGAIAVLMVIIGGLRYVLSAGDPAGTKDAKNAILYAVIGVVVAILSYAIVNFVITKI